LNYQFFCLDGVPAKADTRRKTWLFGGGLNPFVSAGFKPADCLDIRRAWKSGLKPLLSVAFMPDIWNSAFVGGHENGGLGDGQGFIPPPRKLA
jgi:hypothetical protein